MTIIQAEYIKTQIKTLLSVKDILDFYVGDSDRARRYQCPFNHTESHKNLGIKGDHLCRCFSCGESWDEIGFVKKLFNYTTFYEALERIAIDFRFDINQEINKETTKKIRQEKERRDRERRKAEEREKYVSDLYKKICDRQYRLEDVIREHSPYNMDKLGVYAYTKHSDFVIMATSQYIKNEMLLNVLSESSTDDKTDFIYGIAISQKEKKARKDKIIDMIKQGMIKINEKGDVLYG